MLAIFATSEATSLGRSGNLAFSRAYLLVPAYIRILLQVSSRQILIILAQTDVPLYLQNSDTEKLSTDQLCLAFQALVRSASSSNDELSWLCIEEFTVAINERSASSSSRDAKPGEYLLQYV